VRLLVAVIAAVAVCLASIGLANSSHVVCGWEARPPTHWDHVIWVWMENESYEQIVGRSSARYLTRLANECGIATDYTAVSHPSLPNYVAATSGSTWGIADDGPPSLHPISQPSVFSQVVAQGLTWRTYGARCRRWDLPLGTIAAGPLASDLRGDRLTAFAVITPNLCDDMHDCPIAAGDTWLRRWVSKIVSSPEYRSGTTALFITFDEGTVSNRVATVVVSPSTRPATRSSTPFDHIRSCGQPGSSSAFGRAWPAPAVRRRTTCARRSTSSCRRRRGVSPGAHSARPGSQMAQRESLRHPGRSGVQSPQGGRWSSRRRPG
jgi:phosphatidylinositol-3-phosphatase